MNTIFKYTMITFGIYFMVNWMADNPTQLDEVRQNMNTAIGEGTEMASKMIKENLQ